MARQNDVSSGDIPVEVCFPIRYHSVMKLAEYIAQADITLDEFARRIGAANRGVIHKYISKGVVPRPNLMRAIVRETGGAVQPNDFFQSDPVAEQAA